MINLQLKDFQQQTVDFLLEKTTEQTTTNYCKKPNR